MIKDPSPSRRHLMRLGAKAAAKIALIASIPMAISSKAEAAGRHSSFLEWCRDIISPPPGNPPGGAICLLKGTLITTNAGPVPVERLSIGDRILTHAGSFEPIKWIGRMSFRKAPEAEWRFGVAPVRIAKDALWDGAPSRDLFVSQQHALFDGSALVPAAYLINGRTIRVSSPPDLDELQYFNLEFESHQVIYAEGAPVESYRPSANRHLFDNFEEYVALYGPETRQPKPYAPEVRYPRGRDSAFALARLAAACVTAAALDPAQSYERKLKRRSIRMSQHT